MIAVIDSGVANLASVMMALQRLNVKAEVTADADNIRAASRVILPGVGAVGAAMASLRAKGLVDVIRGLTQPVLGICLGMQLLFTDSEEAMEQGACLPCLGVIPGSVRRMQATAATPVPHMGWNQLRLKQPHHRLVQGVAEGDFVYFVHSYAVPVSAITVASADYAGPFTAVAASGNFFGCQFHPERSSDVGSRILKNFLSL